MNKLQDGFAHVMLLVVVVVAVLGFAGYRIWSANNKTAEKTPTTNQQSQTSEAQSKANESSSSSAKIKHLGVNLDYYNPATNKAGDFVFTKAQLHDGLLFMNYGHEIAASSASPAKKNPQPSFILPLGTKVHSLVDGTVVQVSKLYSNDYSIMVQPPGSDLMFETEHVLKPQVKQGDTVKAGQVIAEVSNHDSQHNNGMGLVEIGILKPGNPPSHVCPFDYLDDSIKDDLLKKITAFQKSWEDYRGNSKIYDESKVLIPGCISRDPIAG